MLLLPGLGCASSADQPVTATGHPASGLLITAALDHSRSARGTVTRLQIVLRNTGTLPVPVPPDGPCNPALLISIQDAAGHTVWATPLRMCAPLLPPTDLVLAPGESVTGGACLQWTNNGGWGGASQCLAMAVPAGSYRLTGSFHAQRVPPLDFRVV